MTVVTGSHSSAASSLRGVPVPHGSPTAVPGGRPPGGAAVTRIKLLGRFAVERDGQEIALASFGGRLARQLLRLLALRRGTLVVKELAGLPSRWRDMLGLIALLGRPAPPALLSAASGSGQRTKLQAGPLT